MQGFDQSGIGYCEFDKIANLTIVYKTAVDATL